MELYLLSFIKDMECLFCIRVLCVLQTCYIFPCYDIATNVGSKFSKKPLDSSTILSGKSLSGFSDRHGHAVHGTLTVVHEALQRPWEFPRMAFSSHVMCIWKACQSLDSYLSRGVSMLEFAGYTLRVEALCPFLQTAMAFVGHNIHEYQHGRCVLS